MIRSICNSSVLTLQNLRISLYSNRMPCYPNRISSRKFRTGRFSQTEEGEGSKLSLQAVLMLTIPITCFGLGWWQSERLKWKLALIKEVESRRLREPVPLPNNFSELQKLEYCKVYVKGKFIPGIDLLLGPRRLVQETKTRSPGHPRIMRQPQLGYNVVTPFKLSDSGKTILVNRGWIPMTYAGPADYALIDFDKEMEFTGVVRLSDKRNIFMKHPRTTKFWTERDINGMSEAADTEPIFIDADESITIDGGPIGGQTNVTFRNEHRNYMITWYTLGVLTSFLWYGKYIKLK